jgi:tetratricopeptide (TPR) repeat protein
MTGVSASMAARGAVDFPDGKPAGTPQRERYYALAETAFLRAIAMDSGYTRPLYALGVLYVFELDRPEDAIPHLVKYLDIALSNDVDGMFVLARAYFMTSEYQSALDLYDRILSITKDPAKKAEAERNRKYIMEVYYG